MTEKEEGTLRSLLRIFVLIAIIFLFSIYFQTSKDQENEQILQDINTAKEFEEQSDKIQFENSSISSSERPKKGISSMINRTTKEFVEIYGNPLRKDPSSYGYEWWIYKNTNEEYFQVGVENQKIVAIFAIGKYVNTYPFEIGQSIDSIYSKFMIVPDVELQYENGIYRFEMSEEDMNIRPLIPLGSIYAQLYIDRFTGKLSSVRFMDKETLVKIRPYELVYRGKLLEAKPLTDNDWKMVELANRKQIFDLTNIVRKRFELDPLNWDEETAKVAYSHSKDMADADYFAHISPTQGDLGERLKNADILYQIAGENIAAQYTDAPAVIEGWLNSEGHREAMLNKEFTHIGVGVFQKFYTQNFIKKWESK